MECSLCVYITLTYTCNVWCSVSKDKECIDEDKLNKMQLKLCIRSNGRMRDERWQTAYRPLTCRCLSLHSTATATTGVSCTAPLQVNWGCITYRLTALCPGLPRWAGSRKVEPIWILLKQETASGSGISWAICKSAPSSRQITTPAPHHSVFTGRMPFLPPNQRSQSTEGNLKA